MAATKIGEGTALCLHLQMRSERGAVGSFTLDPKTALLSPDCILTVPKGVIEARLITLLPHRSHDYAPDQGIVSFKAWARRRAICGTTKPVSSAALSASWAAADVTIAEPPNEISAAHAKRSRALQDESAYWVMVFSKLRLNRRRTH
jgi:hypothetical protein